ncbi:MAG: ArsA family ATPase [Myxococcales bacterium]|nr:ArsA family ATPase [Myxococcales bacterium]MCB9643686.1 ArsA family ATPase [Myxococcales bacterium]
MEKLFDRRVIMVTGKGGVGKTTITAALARVAAKQGKRVLALDVERDLESPSTLLKLLGGPDAFRKDEPYVINRQISCARLTPRGGHLQFLIDQVPFKMMAQAAMNSKYLTRFLMAAPGFQELGLIYRMLPYIRKDPKTQQCHYDVVLVDLPATGHALALTSLPKPFLQIFQGGPIRAAIEEAQSYFYDPKVTGAVAITLPEPLPVSETFELLEGLRRDRVPVAGVLVNRIPQDPFEDSERKALLDFFSEHPQEVLGEWSLRRVLRAREALDRLQQGFEQGGSVPVLTLDEQWVEQPGACMAALMQIFVEEPWLSGH